MLSHRSLDFTRLDKQDLDLDINSENIHVDMLECRSNFYAPMRAEPSSPSRDS